LSVEPGVGANEASTGEEGIAGECQAIDREKDQEKGWPSRLKESDEGSEVACEHRPGNSGKGSMMLFPKVTGQIEGRRVGLTSGRFLSGLQFLKLIELC
jgi:hypothetical protein